MRSSADDRHGDGSEQGADGEAGLSTAGEVIDRAIEREIFAFLRTTQNSIVGDTGKAVIAISTHSRHYAAS